MKISEFITQVNVKKNVKPQRIINLKKYYLSMYRVYMVYLYDKMYLDDPTVLNKKLIYKNIIELGIKGMQDVTGTVILSSKQAKYAYYKNTDEEAKEFLDLLSKALYYRECSDAIDKVYEEFDIGGAERKKVSFALKRAGARVYSKLGFEVNEGLLNCLVSDENHVKSISLLEDYWDLAMDILGIPREDWHSDGLFDSSLTHIQEVESMEILLEGLVPLTGKYAKTFEKWLYEHKWAEKGMTNQLQGLYSSIFILRSDEVMEFQSKALNDALNQGLTIVGFSTDSVFYEDRIHTYNLPMSCFSVIGGDSDEQTFEGNILNGYTGECYTAEYLSEEGLNFVGCPIELNISVKKKAYFYDYEQLNLPFNTWFKNEDAQIYFLSKEEVFSENRNPFPVGSLEREIYDIYLKSLAGELVGHISGSYSLTDIESAKKNIMKLLK